MSEGMANGLKKYGQATYNAVETFALLKAGYHGVRTGWFAMKHVWNLAFGDTAADGSNAAAKASREILKKEALDTGKWYGINQLMEFAENPTGYWSQNRVNKEIVPMFSEDAKKQQEYEKFVYGLKQVELYTGATYFDQYFQGATASELISLGIVKPGKIINGQVSLLVDPSSLNAYLASDPAFNTLPAAQKKIVAKMIEQYLTKQLGYSYADFQAIGNNKVIDAAKTLSDRQVETNMLFGTLQKYQLINGTQAHDILFLPEPEYQEKLKLLRFVEDQAKKLNEKAVFDSYVTANASAMPVPAISGDNLMKILDTKDK
ncbi:MAG: hypothetical protein RL023_269 [Candidatus Parcubacteria bacterium]